MAETFGTIQIGSLGTGLRSFDSIRSSRCYSGSKHVEQESLYCLDHMHIKHVQKPPLPAGYIPKCYQ